MLEGVHGRGVRKHFEEQLHAWVLSLVERRTGQAIGSLTLSAIDGLTSLYLADGPALWAET